MKVSFVYPGFANPLIALIWKDLLLEIRTRDILPSLLVFSLLVVIVFNFALTPSPTLIALVGPGILWVAFTFAGMLGLNRTFVLEQDRGNLEGLRLCPIDGGVLYLGKMAASFLFMLGMEIVIYPVFAIMFDLPLFQPILVAIAILATLGFTAVGTTLSAMAVTTRSREVLLPILLLPIVIPVIITAVGATKASILGEGWASVVDMLQLLIVFDIMFLVVAAFTFEFVLED